MQGPVPSSTTDFLHVEMGRVSPSHAPFPGPQLDVTLPAWSRNLG